jgi:UrcA family protein
MAKLSLIMLAAPLMAAGINAPAFAESETRSVTVSYDDLDLSSESGRERLTTRVQMAVKRVCGSADRQTLRERAARQACELNARREADTQLASLFNGSSARLAEQRPVVVAAP